MNSVSWNKIIECVPNFSEGRDLEKIDQIVAPFRIKAGVKLLDYSNDEDHNRLVVTLVGEPEALYEAIVEAVGVAVRLIDLNQHTGQHPRMGAVDVIPFIPIKNTSMEEAIELSKKVAAKVAEILCGEIIWLVGKIFVSTGSCAFTDNTVKSITNDKIILVFI